MLQEIAAVATRVLVMHKGKIIEDSLKGGMLPGDKYKSAEELEEFFLKSIDGSGMDADDA